MTRNLDAVDIVLVRESLLNLQSGTALGAEKQEHAGVLNLPSGSELWLVLILIPFLVSLTSSLLSEFLKGRALSAMRRQEAERILKESEERRLTHATTMDAACLAKVSKLVRPNGISEEEVQRASGNLQPQLSVPGFGDRYSHKCLQPPVFSG